MTTAVLLRSGMMGNYHVPFWRAVEEATPSLTLIILAKALRQAGIDLNILGHREINAWGHIDLYSLVVTSTSKPTG
jgi:hypothetical protein